MATVPNKSGHGPIDKTKSGPNRKVTAPPSGSLVPEFAGEIVLDTSENRLWYALDLTTTGWVPSSLRG